MKKKAKTRREHELYKDPMNLEPQGKAVRRRSSLTQTVPVRMSPQMLAELRAAAEEEYRSVGSFVRLAVANELERRRSPGARSARGG